MDTCITFRIKLIAKVTFLKKPILDDKLSSLTMGYHIT
jgi:hypothetical protein